MNQGGRGSAGGRVRRNGRWAAEVDGSASRCRRRALTYRSRCDSGKSPPCAGIVIAAGRGGGSSGGASTLPAHRRHRCRVSRRAGGGDAGISTRDRKPAADAEARGGRQPVDLASQKAIAKRGRRRRRTVGSSEMDAAVTPRHPRENAGAPFRLAGRRHGVGQRSGRNEARERPEGAAHALGGTLMRQRG